MAAGTQDQISTSPKDISDKGMIASLMTTAWNGFAPSEIGASVSNSRSPLPLIPDPYCSTIKYLVGERNRRFRKWRTETIFGHYMTMGSISEWSKAETMIASSMVKTYEEMAKDRDTAIMDVCRGIGRNFADQEWNRLNPGAGTPTVNFYRAMEEKFTSLVPSAEEIGSAMFWTGYHVPPPSAYIPEPVPRLPTALADRMYRTFSRQVVFGLRDAILETCDYTMNIVKKSGEPNKLYQEGLIQRMERMQPMYFLDDDITVGMIKNLKDMSLLCYKDVKGAIEAATELRNRVEKVFNELIIW